jgi:hypothetical protein
VFSHRKVGISDKLAALLDMLFFGCKFNIGWPDMSDFYYILIPSFKLERAIAYKTS